VVFPPASGLVHRGGPNAFNRHHPPLGTHRRVARSKVSENPIGWSRLISLANHKSLCRMLWLGHNPTDTETNGNLDGVAGACAEESMSGREHWCKRSVRSSTPGRARGTDLAHKRESAIEMAAIAVLRRTVRHSSLRRGCSPVWQEGRTCSPFLVLGSEVRPSSKMVPRPRHSSRSPRVSLVLFARGGPA